MARTRIKFCGITRPQDAVAAAEIGADAIGLIFYPRSPRFISIDQARQILNVLPAMVTPVGLFVNSTPAEVRDIANTLNLRTLQLHGDESPDFAAELKGFSLIKALRCHPQEVETAIVKWASSGVSAVLLETSGTIEPGGTGVENNWSLLQTISRSMSHKPLIAAGGLTPENVEHVVKLLRPWAVDVSTGIEVSPGIKSRERMQRFADAVRAADMDLIPR